MNIKQYHHLVEIKSGPCDTIFTALNSDHQAVIIKTLHLDRLEKWKELDLFRREIEVMARLKLKQIPRLIEQFQEGNTLYLVQEAILGKSLEQLIKEGFRFDDQLVISFVEQLLTTLNELHKKGIIHRDIKPANIVMGDDQTFYLIDFGSVTVTLPGESSGSTVVGSYGYTPPEQLIARTAPASDLYALGVTLIALLTHKFPEEIDTTEMRLDYRPLISISNPFAEFIDQLIAPFLTGRIQSAREALSLFSHGKIVTQKRGKRQQREVILTGKTRKGEVVELSRNITRVPLYHNLNRNEVSAYLKNGAAIALLSNKVFQNSAREKRVKVRIVNQELDGWLDLSQTSFIRRYNSKEEMVGKHLNFKTKFYYFSVIIVVFLVIFAVVS